MTRIDALRAMLAVVEDHRDQCGEVSATGLATATAASLECDHSGGPLDDEGHWLWTLAAKVAGSVFTDHDIEHVRSTAAELRALRDGQARCDEGQDCTAPRCDCGGAETVMLSRGYVDVDPDGGVTARGVVIATVHPAADDGVTYTAGTLDPA